VGTLQSHWLARRHALMIFLPFSAVASLSIPGYLISVLHAFSSSVVDTLPDTH